MLVPGLKRMEARLLADGGRALAGAGIYPRLYLAFSRNPPPPRRHNRPDGFHHAERPSSLQKSIDRSQYARSGKSQYEPHTPFFERVAHQHGGDREKTEGRESVHAQKP